MKIMKFFYTSFLIVIDGISHSFCELLFILIMKTIQLVTIHSVKKCRINKLLGKCQDSGICNLGKASKIILINRIKGSLIPMVICFYLNVYFQLLYYSFIN